MKRSTLIGGLAVGFALAVTVSAPASATPVQIIPWEESFTEVLEVGTENWCPPDVVDFDVTYSFDGGGTDRIYTQRDGILRFAGTFKAVETFSANGKTFMIESQGNRRDHKIVDNGDGTLTIEFKNSVKSTASLDGEFLFHDSGLDEGDFLVDHNGTPTFPDDDIFLGVVGEPQFHGRSDTAGRDFCEDIAFFLAP